MPVDLANVNISLQKFQDISSGKYNAGEIRITGRNSLGKVNNHVSRLGQNVVPLSHEEVMAVKTAFIKALASGGVAADAIDYPPALVVADIDWTDRHPIKQVYQRCDCDTDQRMWDPLAVIQAVEGDTAFSMGERGTVEVTEEARTVFIPSPSGNCRRQLPGNPAWNAAMLEKIRAFTREMLPM